LQPYIFLASRYIWPRKADKKNTTKLLSIFGLSAGVITLISVMSVMNGLQFGFINDILEIESYHIRIYNVDDKEGVIRTLENSAAVQSFARFYDTQTLIQSGHRLDPVMVRLISEGDFRRDKSLIKSIGIEEDHVDIAGDFKVIIGAELARVLRVFEGDTISLLSLSGRSFATLRPDVIDFTITGIFRSGYFQFDRSMIFISDEHMSLFEHGAESRDKAAAESNEGFYLDNRKIIGVKLKNRYRDLQTIFEIKTAHPNAEVVSWRERNRSFFNALRMERVVMFLLVTLIFVVIGVNIFNSIKRTVAEKLEDIAVLYAIGASEKAVRKIFFFEGVIIGFISGLSGVILGLLLIVNINEIFMIFGIAAMYLLMCVEFIASTAGLSDGFSFTLFPSDYFYLAEIPVRIVLPEIVTVFLFALFAGALSAYFASKKISVANPTEYLRHE